VGHSDQMTESYKNMEILLHSPNFDSYNWLICGDLKVCSDSYVNIKNTFLFLQVVSLVLQGGYTKYPCFLCMWDSIDDQHHYVKHYWPLREALQPGSHNVLAYPLVSPSKIILPLLHIKLGLMKNFVKALKNWHFLEEEISSCQRRQAQKWYI
jgi:hypothetical protein